jgi:hypothetical protein
MNATALDSFTRAYLAACLWSSNDDAGNPLDSDYSADDFTPEALQRAVDDCAKFQAQAADMMRASRKLGDAMEYAGHDFWLTRCGHGAGFWDGDWPEHGDALTALCKGFPNLDPYVGDDGQIHF